MEGGIKMAIHHNPDKEEAERVLEQLYKLLAEIQIENGLKKLMKKMKIKLK